MPEPQAAPDVWIEGGPGPPNQNANVYHMVVQFSQMLANIKHSISVFNEQFFDVYENSSNCEKRLCLAWVQFANSQKDHRKLTVWETKLTESSQQAHCELILWAHSELIKCPQNELTVTPPGELSVSFVWAFSEVAVRSNSSLGNCLQLTRRTIFFGPNYNLIGDWDE